nr:1,6-anhydro-N-acetylmuramyl-L-alanine amidase AmpD [Suttonella ornithocola]
MITKIEINSDGWLLLSNLCQIIRSPYFNQRPPNTEIDTIVLHNISLPPLEFGQKYINALFLGTLPKLQDKHPYFKNIAHLKVSAHFFIGRNGIITQYVSTLNRAWHAGQSQYKNRENYNNFSIGIELNGADYFPYTLKQYQTLAQLILALKQRHPKITLDNITTHSQISPNRKTDPGPAFNLNFLLHSLKNLR